MELIAIIRSEGGNFQKYLTLLNENNFNPILVPAIEFQYKSQQELKNELNCPESYSGIIFTSPRSVTAIHLVLNGDVIRNEWKTKRNYCVGVSTWNEAHSKLDFDPVGKESGSATNLAELIVNDFKSNPSSLPLLFPCSSIKKDTLPEKLSSNGIQLKCLDVYDTIPHSKLEENLQHIVMNDEIKSLVFFSPSGVESCIEVLNKSNLNFNSKRLIAIGETTKKAIIEKGLECHFTCKTPSPEGLLECLLESRNS
uniref:Uroporphyrinogen-III synthase n=1 Tax=Culicoides sonorensis TaxID=179676 RepID=A0A336MUY8_CULSO